MLIYILFFLIAIYIYQFRGNQQNKTVLFCYIVGLSLFVGFGDIIGGYDRYIYGAHFDSFADSINALNWDEVSWKLENETRPSEWGFSMLYIIVGLFSMNRYIFIFCVTILIYSLLFVSFKRYIQNYPMAMMLFLGLWFFFTFTYLRQVLACTIAWLGVKYIIDRDLKRFSLLVFIAYSMHNSAIIFFPFYFVPVKKFSPRVVVNIMAVLLVLGLTNLPASLFGVFGSLTETEHRAGQYVDDYAVRYEYILEALLFLYVILSNYKKIPNTRLNIVFLNMSLAFCGILLLFCLNTQGGRLSWFYMLGLITTLSYIAKTKKLFSQDNIVLISLSFFLFFRVLDAWSFNLTPYKTFFTPGHTGAEWIYELHEYDEGYDVDKFYRPAFRIPKR
jgi:hypothetical protein